MYRLLFIFLLIIASNLTGFSQSDFLKLKNLVSTYSSVDFNDPAQYSIGFRYIPTINLTSNLKKGRSIDAEFSFNALVNYYHIDNGDRSWESNLEPYRAWIRYTSPRFELRAGLQKISFGSASILRPLMWFDRMDYRDPLQLTPGVYSLLGKYYFQNNINIWVWFLYGNKDIKGWEIVATQEKRAEYGGRFQIPFAVGEMALSYHYRSADYTRIYLMDPQVTDPFFDENFFGLDGKWDIGPGISFEYVYKINNPDNYLMGKTEKYINLGIDYTFNLGNGFNMAGEYFRYKGTSADNYAALVLNYHFGLMNNVMLALYYNTNNEDVYSLITLKKDYNYLSLNFMAYWNPAETGLYLSPDGKALLAGKGLQFIAVVNF